MTGVRFGPEIFGPVSGLFQSFGLDFQSLIAGLPMEYDDLGLDNHVTVHVSEMEMRRRDVAFYAMLRLNVHLLIAFIFHHDESIDEKRQRFKAIQRIVQWSSTKVFGKASQDAFADCMRPIYWDRALCFEFCHSGGLPVLIRHLVRTISSVQCL